MAREIVTIAAATGWSAELGADEPGGAPRRVTLVGWALVDDGGSREVVGLVLRPRGDAAGPVGFADEAPSFLGYAFGGVRVQSG
jgi:hypothetical protein